MISLLAITIKYPKKYMGVSNNGGPQYGPKIVGLLL